MAIKSTSVKLTLKITSFIIRFLLNIVFYILVVMLIINVSKSAFDFTYQLYGPVTMDEAPGVTIDNFVIKKGESTMNVASKLELNRVIKNKYAFYLKVKLQNIALMPGVYTVNTSMTYNEIINVISNYDESNSQEE